MQGKLAAQKLRLEEVQQRRKHVTVKLQEQGDTVAKWQGEGRRLTNVVLHNNINSGKFFEVRLPFPLPFTDNSADSCSPGLMSGFDGILCVALSTCFY